MMMMMIEIMKTGPVGAEDVEGGWLVTVVVNLHHGDGGGLPGDDLLALKCGALESLPHVDVLQGDCDMHTEITCGHVCGRGQLAAILKGYLPFYCLFEFTVDAKNTAKKRAVLRVS